MFFFIFSFVLFSYLFVRFRIRLVSFVIRRESFESDKNVAFRDQGIFDLAPIYLELSTVIPRWAGSIFRVIWIPVLAARKVGRSSSTRWRTPRGESLFRVEGISWPCSCGNEHGIVLGTKVHGFTGRETSTGLLRKSSCNYSKHQVFECESSELTCVFVRISSFLSYAVLWYVSRQIRNEQNMFNSLLKIEYGYNNGNTEFE